MKYTQDQMQATVNEWRNSGLSKKAFCRAQNIAYPTFHYWCKRIKGNSASVPSGFAELNVTGASGCSFEVVLLSGSRLIFQSEPSAVWLRELLG